MDENEALMKALAKMQAQGKITIVGETIIDNDAPEGTAEKAFSGMGMVFAFTDQSQSFAYGFEAGMVWQKLQSGELAIDCGFQEGFPVRAENLDLYGRMAASAGFKMETEYTGYEGWWSLRLSKSGKPKPSLRAV